jgi:hypothetical protein
MTLKMWNLPITTGHMGTQITDVGIPPPQRTELRDESTALLSVIFVTLEDSQCWSKHVVYMNQYVGEPLMSKTGKNFNNEVACETDNN